MLRKIVGLIKFIGRRKSRYLLVIALWAVLLFVALSWSDDVGRALKTPPPPEQALTFFRRSTDIAHYLDEIQVLIEPSAPCSGKVPVIILVASAPSHVEQRQAIRHTWGKYQPTFFIMGLQGPTIDERLVDNYVEAKQYGDMVIFEMVDHYQNLTLKTVLMLQWTLETCPQAEHMFKTDDDVVVNPWTLTTVLKDHPDDKLIGYRINNTKFHRDEYNKFFVPRWLAPRDVILQYLVGTGYIIKGQYLHKLLKAALKTPLINLEDVYLTYLVANVALGYELTHEPRLCAYKPWVPLDCAYWSLASIHCGKPHELVHAWARIQRIADNSTRDSCSFYKTYLQSDLFLY